MELRIGRRFWIATAAAVAVGLGMGLAVVAAHEAKYESDVELTTTTSVGSTGAMAGTVSSEPTKRGCEERRRVGIWRERAGHDKLVKSGRSNGEGEWFILFGEGLKLGDHYPKVDPLRLSRAGSNAHRHVCAGSEGQAYSLGFPDPDPD